MAQSPVFSDAFNANGALLGTSPQTGGNWTITGASITNPLTVSSGALNVNATGQDAYSAFSSAIPTTNGNGIRTDVTINVSAIANTAGDYFLHLSDPVGTSQNFYQRVFIRSTGTGAFNIGLLSTSGGTGLAPTFGATNYNFNTNYQVSVLWNFISGLANDTFSLSVNGTNEISNYTWVNGSEPNSFVSAVNIRQGTVGPVLTVDNLVVTPVPEPATILGLSAITVAAGSWLRRTRRVPA
jgi:hypothetical protein